MANKEHVSWLLEGVESWNARRAKTAFTPDLSNLEFLKTFERDPTTNLLRLNLSGINLRGARLPNSVLTGTILKAADLREADLSDCDMAGIVLTDALLGQAVLARASLKGAQLQRANLWQVDMEAANAEQADLGRANLFGANLSGAKFNKAELTKADLRTAKLYQCDLSTPNIDGADIRTVEKKSEDGLTTHWLYTDLSDAQALPLRQLQNMLGDSQTHLPEGVARPDTWGTFPEETSGTPHSRRKGFDWSYAVSEPDLPQSAPGNDVALHKTQLVLAQGDRVPARADLDALYEDLREAAQDLRDVGNLSNQSPMLAKGIERFLRRVPDQFVDLEQVRFGVALQALHLQYIPEKPHLADTSPEKTGHIDAVLMQADLIVARLPEWQTFLAEESDERAQIEAKVDDTQAILEHAAEALEADPEHFDPSLFERIREYLEDRTIEAYLASKNLLLNIAHRTFSLARDLAKDTVSEVRKGVIKNIARALQVQLGAVLLNLAGLLPRELKWLVNWLEYLPTLLA